MDGFVEKFRLGSATARHCLWGLALALAGSTQSGGAAVPLRAQREAEARTLASKKSWLLRRPQAAAAEQLNKMVDLVVQIKVLQRDLNEANGAGRPESAADGAPPKEKRVRFDS